MAEETHFAPLCPCAVMYLHPNVSVRYWSLQAQIIIVKHLIQGRHGVCNEDGSCT